MRTVFGAAGIGADSLRQRKTYKNRKAGATVRKLPG